MLSGTPPFQAADTRRLEQQILSRQPPGTGRPLSRRARSAIVAKLLGPHPAERYDSARRFARTSSASAPGDERRAKSRAGPRAPVTTPRETQTTPAADRRRRRRHGGRSRHDPPRSCRHRCRSALRHRPVPAQAVAKRQRAGAEPAIPGCSGLLLFIALGLDRQRDLVRIGGEPAGATRRATRDFDELARAGTQYGTLVERSHLAFGIAHARAVADRADRRRWPIA